MVYAGARKNVSTMAIISLLFTYSTSYEILDNGRRGVHVAVGEDIGAGAGAGSGAVLVEDDNKHAFGFHANEE
jgi:hypothetical protein